MSTLITGDIHLSDNPRDRYRHDFISKVLPVLIHKHQPSALIIAGDLCEAKDHHSAWLVNQLVDHFWALTKLCKIIIIKGNHDYIEADNPFFEFLGRIEGIIWINTPIYAQGVLYLPHTPNYERDWKGLDLKQPNVIFAHQTFQGASIGPRKLDGIPLDIFPKDAEVISGDIHVPQTFGPITYIGSPYLIDFGDDFKPRVLLRTEQGKLTSIPCPGAQKRLIEINSLADLKRQPAVQPGDILKVRVSLAPAQHAEWPAIKEAVHVWGKKNGYNIFLVQPQVTRPQAGTEAQPRKTVTRTDKQLMEDYAKARAVDAKTLRTGMNLIEKV